MKWCLMWLTVVLAACADDALTPEEQILNQLTVMETAAQERRTDDLVDYIASDYSDNKSLTRDKIHRALALRFLQQKSVHVFSKVTSITMQPSADTQMPDAHVVLYAGIARAPFESLADLTDIQVDVVRFNLQLRHASDRWMVQASTWHRASLTDIF